MLFKIDEYSKPIPAVVDADLDLMEFAGLWLADGCYDGKYGMVLSVGEEELKSVVRRVADKFGLKTRTHSDDFSTMASNTNLVWFFKNVVGLNGDAYTKKCLLGRGFKRKTKSALPGLYSGDGSVSKYEVNLSLCSKQLVEETQTMLLSFGVHSRMATVPNKRDKTNALRASSVEFQKKFLQIGFFNPLKQQKLEKLVKRMPTHDVGDVIPLSNQVKELISQSSPKFNSHDYIARQNNIGRRKLTEIASSCSNNQLSNQLMELCQSDVYFDKVAKVTKLDQTKQFVYDFSVPDCENFLLKTLSRTTPQKSVPALKRMGFNIQRMKARPPLGKQSGRKSRGGCFENRVKIGSWYNSREVRSGGKALYEQCGWERLATWLWELFTGRARHSIGTES